MHSYRKTRTLEELNLIDGFLFGSLLNNPEYGPIASKSILELIIGRRLNSFTVDVEKPIFGNGPQLHGIRLDAMIDETGAGDCPNTIFNLEPNTYTLTSEVFSRRSRYYHSKIDGHILKSGEIYRNLKNVFVIFIMEDDPFGQNRIRYTFKTTCLEDPGIHYNDGSTTLCLYTKGNPDGSLYEDKLSKLLRYIESSTLENAKFDKSILQLHEMVTAEKHSKELGVAYMSYEELIYFEKEKALSEVNEIIKKKDSLIEEQGSLIEEMKHRISELEALNNNHNQK